MFYVHPELWGKRTQFDEHIFSNGLVKNHQPENNGGTPFFFSSVDRNRTLKCPITTNPFVLVKRIGTAPWLRETGVKHVWEHVWGTYR